jgi:YHS domain-containing protein
MVGLGGFSPVALGQSRQWKKGSENFVAAHEGVDYFFQSTEEIEQFRLSPSAYIPRLHGCDLVELSQENRATTGAIEYGSFYQGQVFFFASIENRVQFEQNPSWYSGVRTDAGTASDQIYPFLNSDVVNN